MPIYEYVCLECGSKFDALRPMSEADAPIACSKCEGKHTSRKLSVFFAHSDGRVVTQSAPGCSSCLSTSCSTCGIKH